MTGEEAFKFALERLEERVRELEEHHLYPYSSELRDTARGYRASVTIIRDILEGIA